MNNQPNYQNTPQNMPQKKKGLPVWAIVLIVIAVFAVIGAVVGGTQNSNDPVSSSSDNGNQTQQEETKILKVGDSFQTRYFKITLKAYDPDYKDYNELLAPDAGNKYIYFEWEYQNTMDNDNQYSYSSGDFSCYVDNTLVNSSALVGDNGTWIGELSYGRVAKVTVAYEVPVDCETIELEWSSIFEDSIKLKVQ